MYFMLQNFIESGSVVFESAQTNTFRQTNKQKRDTNLFL